MPTTKPRYTVTDTARTAELLDLAARAWPEVGDRRQLLMRLTEAGGREIEREFEQLEARVTRQRDALDRARERVDTKLLLDDRPWA